MSVKRRSFLAGVGAGIGTLLSFAGFEKGVMAEVGVTSPIELARQIRQDHVWHVMHREREPDCGRLMNECYLSAETCLTEDEANRVADVMLLRLLADAELQTSIEELWTHWRYMVDSSHKIPLVLDWIYSVFAARDMLDDFNDGMRIYAEEIGYDESEKVGLAFEIDLVDRMPSFVLPPDLTVKEARDFESLLDDGKITSVAKVNLFDTGATQYEKARKEAVQDAVQNREAEDGIKARSEEEILKTYEARRGKFAKARAQTLSGDSGKANKRTVSKRSRRSW